MGTPVRLGGRGRGLIGAGRSMYGIDELCVSKQDTTPGAFVVDEKHFTFLFREGIKKTPRRSSPINIGKIVRNTQDQTLGLDPQQLRAIKATLPRGVSIKETKNLIDVSCMRLRVDRTQAREMLNRVIEIINEVIE